MMRWIGPISILVLLVTSGVACQAEPAMGIRSDAQSESQAAQQAPKSPAAAKPAQAKTEARDESSRKEAPDRRPTSSRELPSTGDFAENAFPPTIPDTEWHQHAWLELDCLRCHETGVGEAPMVVHEDMPSILLTAKCRSCHVQVRGALLDRD